MNDTQTATALAIHRHYSAAPERVYAAWTDPIAAAIFLGPSDVQASEVAIDLRVGGRYDIVMRMPGGEQIDVGGVYREIVPARRLQMTWRWREDDPKDEYDTLLTVEFTRAADGGTDFTLTHERFATPESRDRHRHGWSSITEKLDAFLRTGLCVGTDLADGRILATALMPASVERTFAALASPEVTTWWVRPGVFDTREWNGEVRVGGHWSASGIGRGEPYTLGGEFTACDAPHRLAHTWQTPAGETTAVAYELRARDGGTQLVLRHDGFASASCCENTAIGWETSLERLIAHLRAAG